MGVVVRIASVRVSPERIDELINHYRQTLRPLHQRMRGL